MDLFFTVLNNVLMFVFFIVLILALAAYAYSTFKRTHDVEVEKKNLRHEVEENKNINARLRHQLNQRNIHADLVINNLRDEKRDLATKLKEATATIVTLTK